MRAFLLGLGICLGLTLWPAAATAQTHPCDAFTAQVPVPLGPVSMDMCWNEKSDTGQPVTFYFFAPIIDNI